MGLLDFLFPKYCVFCKSLGSYLCADCFAKLSFSQKTMCLVCGKSAIDGLTHPHCQNAYTVDGAFIALEYVGVMKKLMYVFKYQPYVQDLSRMLSELFVESLIQKEAFMAVLNTHTELLLMPIPLHAKKLRARGYNHATLLAKHLSKKLRIPLMDGLVRTKETVIQARLSKQQRKENIRGAFALKKVADVKGKTIFVVDDILTTGTTCLEAANVLKKAGAKSVYALALCGEN